MQQDFPLDLTFQPKDTMIALPSSCSYIPDTKTSAVPREACAQQVQHSRHGCEISLYHIT